MKGSIYGPLPLLLFLSSITSGLTSVVSKYYIHIINGSTWMDAQSYCRSHYTDLATIYTQSDVDLMYMSQYNAWVNLRRDSSDTQDWTYIGNIETGEIDNSSDQSKDCAAADYDNHKVYAQNCGNHYFFICQTTIPTTSVTIHSLVTEAKTWSEAKAYCTNHFGILASYGSYQWYWSSVLIERDFNVWIGLHKDGGSWTWSTSFSNYLSWKSGQTSTGGDCVSITSLTKKMAAQDCGTVLPFVCISENVFLVKENKSWEEALEHCRGLTNTNLHFDLLSVEPGEENQYVWNKIMEAETKEVWTGLRFLAGEWFWVNGANVLYPDLPSSPDSTHHCGALSKANTGRMEPRNCIERNNFLCYSYNP